MLQASDFTPRVLNTIADILNKGYECELKNPSNNLIVIKIKRKLLYKVKDDSDIKNYLLDNIIGNLTEGTKVEFKREKDQIAIVLVTKTEANRSKGTL